MAHARLWILLLAAALLGPACRRGADDGTERARGEPRPWILLVTLDTTRADAIGPGAAGVETPAFNRIAARGRRFLHAYATAPETLPSHASMMTGLYPAGHGIHENARFLTDVHPVAAERVRQAGYDTAAFVSSFVLARRFGLSRGFLVYDDELAPGAVERSAAATTDRAIAFLTAADRSGAPGESRPVFAWVHYFDPHAPYEAPGADVRERYRGEIAAMDAQLGRLLRAFEEAAARAGREPAIILASDHGEGLGDHGELQHGNLLYQPTMHVPLVIAGPGVSAGPSEMPVSVRRVYHTVLDWAGVDAADSLRADRPEVVLAEAMKPFLSYGWQPQIMAVDGTLKAIFAGTTEVYDLARDPAETRDLGSGANVPAEVRRALDDYPVPSPEAARAPEQLTDEARRSLASLGYVSGGAAPVVRRDAPRPADMTAIFETIDRASTLFVNGRYREVIPLLQAILARDPHNLDATLRLAMSHSMLGQHARALDAFRRAAALAPKSEDVRLYLALHYARTDDWREAAPVLERIVSETPDRIAAVEGLAMVRERQGRLSEAVQLLQRAYALRPPSPAELVRLGDMAMAAGRTAAAIEAFERARAAQGQAFARDLELGVLYLDARRLPEARDALDRIPPSHPEYPMALFKRAQVSVLLNEPDARARIDLARKHANATTRELIAREKLFQR